MHAVVNQPIDIPPALADLNQNIGTPGQGAGSIAVYSKKTNGFGDR